MASFLAKHADGRTIGFKFEEGRCWLLLLASRVAISITSAVVAVAAVGVVGVARVARVSAPSVAASVPVVLVSVGHSSPGKSIATARLVATSMWFVVDATVVPVDGVDVVLLVVDWSKSGSGVGDGHFLSPFDFF